MRLFNSVYRVHVPSPLSLKIKLTVFLLNWSSNSETEWIFFYDCGFSVRVIKRVFQKTCIIGIQLNAF